MDLFVWKVSLLSIFHWMAISSLKVEKMGVVWRGNSSKTSSPARMRGEVMKTYPNAPRALETHCCQCFFFENNKPPNIRNYQHYQLFWRSLILKDSQVCVLEFFLFRTSFWSDARSDILLPQDTTKCHLTIAENRHQAIDLQIFRLPSRLKHASHNPMELIQRLSVLYEWSCLHCCITLFHLTCFICFVFLFMCWNSTATSLRDPKICWTRWTHSREAPMSCCKTLRCPRISAGATRMASDPTESVICYFFQRWVLVCRLVV